MHVFEKLHNVLKSYAMEYLYLIDEIDGNLSYDDKQYH